MRSSVCGLAEVKRGLIITSTSMLTTHRVKNEILLRMRKVDSCLPLSIKESKKSKIGKEERKELNKRSPLINFFSRLHINP